jgi:hypothetical protein
MLRLYVAYVYLAGIFLVQAGICKVLKMAVRLLPSTLLFFSIRADNRPATQVRTVTVHEPTFNEQGA